MEGGVSVYFWLPFCYNLLFSFKSRIRYAKKAATASFLRTRSPQSLCRLHPLPSQDAADHSFVLSGETRIQPVLSVLYFPGFLASFCRQRSGVSALLNGETGEKGIFFGLALCSFR